MPAPKKQNEKVVKMSDKKTRDSRPASNPESREKQMVNLAVELAEKQLKDGTASAAVITHYLKIGSTREVIERDMLSKQAELMSAKATSIVATKDTENIAKNAMEAMKNYNSSSS